LCGSFPKSSRTTVGLACASTRRPDDFVDVLPFDAGVLERLPDRRHRPLNQVVDELFGLGAGQFQARCFGPLWSAVMNGRLMSVRGGESSILAFSPLPSGAAPPSGPCRDRSSVFLNSPRSTDHALVEIVAAQMRIAVGGLDLDDAVAHPRTEMSNVPPPKS
jgi:hypothetical protein